MSTVLEKELTCSICTDILLDPVTFLDCLHTNCGSCAKRWFGTQPAPTCPVCRERVRDVRPNIFARSLLEDFLAQHPDKKRSDADIAECRSAYRPGDTISVSAGGGPAAAARAVSPLADDAAPLEDDILQIPRLFSAPQNFVRLSRMDASVRPIGPNADDGMLPLLLMNQAGIARSPSPPRSQRMGDILRRNAPVVHILCDSCGEDRSNGVFLECTGCIMFRLCPRCAQRGKKCPEPPTAGHFLLPQKLLAPPARRLQTGIFCSVCEAFCGESRGGAVVPDQSVFWHCRQCAPGDGWYYCQRCVGHGACCTHDLRLYTNTFPPGISVPQRQALEDMVARAMVRLNRPQANDNNNEGHWPGYVRSTQWNISCDHCLEHIPADHCYFHCYECRDGSYDMCSTCFFTYQDGGTNVDAAQFLCPRSHAMAMLSQDGTPGTHKVISLPPQTPPEWIVAARPASEEPRRAVATSANWQDESNADAYADNAEHVAARDRRKWGRAGLLSFPLGAVIENVVTAFCDDTLSEADTPVTFCWGWYTGVGGLFPRESVEFV